MKMPKKRVKRKNKESTWVFWLAVSLSVLGIVAVIVLALNALGII